MSTWGWPANLVHNLQFFLSKNGPQAQEKTIKLWGLVLPFFKSRKVISCTSLSRAHLEQETPSMFFPTICSARETTKKNPTYELRMRTNFQRFLNKAPRSSFKKLILSAPLLPRGLHTMSLTKSVLDGLKLRECKRTKLREPPTIPYIPEKDKV